MTDSMKKYLTLASQPRGVSPLNINDHLAAGKAGWVRCIGASQNCTNLRYQITDAGKAALNGAD